MIDCSMPIDRHMTDLPSREEILNVVRKFFFHYDERTETLTDALMEMLAKRNTKSES